MRFRLSNVNFIGDNCSPSCYLTEKNTQEKYGSTKCQQGNTDINTA